MQDLTRQLLAFARRQVIAPVPLDLNELVLRSEKLLRRVLGEDVELIATLQPDLWTVRCDPGQLEQVVLNLAVNARGAMPSGGKLTIETANVGVDERFTLPPLDAPRSLRRRRGGDVRGAVAGIVEPDQDPPTAASAGALDGGDAGAGVPTASGLEDRVPHGRLRDVGFGRLAAACQHLWLPPEMAMVSSDGSSVPAVSTSTTQAACPRPPARGSPAPTMTSSSP